jgi:hypothetical protein
MKPVVSGGSLLRKGESHESAGQDCTWVCAVGDRVRPLAGAAHAAAINRANDDGAAARSESACRRARAQAVRAGHRIDHAREQPVFISVVGGLHVKWILRRVRCR